MGMGRTQRPAFQNVLCQAGKGLFLPVLLGCNPSFRFSGFLLGQDPPLVLECSLGHGGGAGKE